MCALLGKQIGIIPEGVFTDTFQLRIIVHATSDRMLNELPKVGPFGFLGFARGIFDSRDVYPAYVTLKSVCSLADAEEFVATFGELFLLLRECIFILYESVLTVVCVGGVLDVREPLS